MSEEKQSFSDTSTGIPLKCAHCSRVIYGDSVMISTLWYHPECSRSPYATLGMVDAHKAVEAIEDEMIREANIEYMRLVGATRYGCGINRDMAGCILRAWLTKTIPYFLED